MSESAYEAEAETRRIVAYTRERAVRLLAGREHGRKELTHKLVTRDLDPDIVDAVIDRLVEQGLQSDLRFAEAYTRSRAGRGFGEIGVRMELKNRGVDGDVINQGVQEAGCNWLDVAICVLEKKFRGKEIDNPEQQARMRRFLFGRGFDSSHVSDAIQALAGQ